MKRLLSLILLTVLLATAAGPAYGDFSLAPGPGPNNVDHFRSPAGRGEDEECYYSGPVPDEGGERLYKYYFPLIERGARPRTSEANMANATIQARLSAAKRQLTEALTGQFQGRITYRHGVVDYSEYDDNGRLIRATMTVDSVANVPVIAGAGDALHVGDSIQVENRGTPAAPAYKYDFHLASSYGAAGTSPAATLPTPTGLALTTTLRHPTTGGQVAAITVTWNALSEMIMSGGGYYEVEIRRNDELTTGDGHVSRCPHQLGSTALNGSATYGDATVTVDSTSTFPSSGKFKLADSTVTFTGKTVTTFTGCTWAGGSGTYADDTGVTGLTLNTVFDHVQTGTDYNVRVRAVAVSGATSEWTSWASITTGGDLPLEVADQFDRYSRADLANLESLWVLPVDGFEDLAAWATVGGSSGKAADTTARHFIEGQQGISFVGNGYLQRTPSPVWDLSVANRFGPGDFVLLHGSSSVEIASAELNFESNWLVSRYFSTLNAYSVGEKWWAIKKGDFEIQGTPAWSYIHRFEIYNGSGVNALTVDDLMIVKADPDDPATYNPTGPTWDFSPALGDGNEVRIYEGNRPGEPAKPYSMGFVYATTSPANWLLGYHTLSDIYYGTAVAGFFLKGDGEAMLAFCIQDPAVATRTMYAVELDTATDHVRLVKWIAGERTQIAEADFVSAPNQIVWLGTDWRDFGEEGRINVYATLVEGNVIQASNLVLSETDTDVQRGGYVGVGFKEVNGRVVDFRAGSPQHAMTAEVAFLANKALTADWAAEAAEAAEAATLVGGLDTAYNSGASVTVDGEPVNLVGSGKVLDLSTKIWQLGEVVLNLDFTGTAYNTVAKCNAVGLRFSAVDTPFPTTLAGAHTNGSWSHSAGLGWLPAATTDNCGPSILLPLCRPGNWEADWTLNYSPDGVNREFMADTGFLNASSHVAFLGRLADFSGTAIQVIEQLITNDGDDTFTTQDTGAALAGAGNRTLKVRCINGCYQVWDPQDSTWYSYTARQAAGIGYTPAWVYLQIRKNPSYSVQGVYIANFKLTYLL